MSPQITAISGPLEGQVFELEDEEVSIGRHNSNAIQLAEISVSRRHCVLRPEPNGVWLEDCSSENGTYFLHTRGTKIRDLTKEEHSRFLAYEVRGFSGTWILFSLIPAVYFLSVKSRYQQSIEPGQELD